MTPILSVVPSSLDFGCVSLGGHEDLEAVIANDADDPSSVLQVTSITVNGSGFSLLSSPSLPVSIPGDTTVIHISIRFAPPGQEPATGILVVTAPGAINSPRSTPLSGSTCGAPSGEETIVESGTFYLSGNRLAAPFHLRHNGDSLFINEFQLLPPQAPPPRQGGQKPSEPAQRAHRLLEEVSANARNMLAAGAPRAAIMDAMLATLTERSEVVTRVSRRDPEHATVYLRNWVPRPTVTEVPFELTVPAPLPMVREDEPSPAQVLYEELRATLSDGALIAYLGAGDRLLVAPGLSEAVDECLQAIIESNGQNVPPECPELLHGLTPEEILPPGPRTR